MTQRQDENLEPAELWQTVSSEQPLVTPWFSIRRDQVQTHTGDVLPIPTSTIRGLCLSCL